MESSNVDVSAVPSAATSSGFCRCTCGRRTSSKTHDHHSFCVHCRGFSCNFNDRCDECKALTDKDFQTYLRHQRSLRRKALSKQRLRAKAADAAAVVDPMLTHVVSPSASASSEGVGIDVDEQHPVVENPSQSGISLDQIKELLGSFSRSFEEKFQNMSNRIDNLSQDLTNANNSSFSAPYAVAGRAELAPDKVPHCLYSDGRGSTLGGPAAALAPSGVDSLTRVSFESLIDRVRELELHFG